MATSAENQLIDELEYEIEQEEASEQIGDAVGDGLDVQDKCQHGVYIPRGYSFAPYCTGCAPGRGIISQPDRSYNMIRPERQVDASEYLHSPIYERLKDAERMFSL